VDNVKMDLGETGCGGVDCGLGQDRDKCRALVNVVMNLWTCSIKFLETNE
jgi:hypothetical protein